MRRHPFQDRLRSITREIVATYEASPIPASHIGPERRLPSRRAVVRILENLFAVLYPGFYGVQHLTAENVEYHVGALLDDLAADLHEQACLAFRFEEPDGGGRPQDRIEADADTAVSEFLLRIPEVRRRLMLDFMAAMEGDPARKQKILSRTPMKCFGQSEDIGWAAVYLCSPAAKFVTGVVLPVDGGMSIGF